MAGLLSALVFPYTDIPEQSWELLSPAFSKVYLLQAAGMTPSPLLDRAQASGALEIVRPGAKGFDQAEIKQILSQTGEWVANIRDPREIAHLKGMLGGDMEESSPLSLATAIRHHGQDPENKDFMAHLLLHLAAWHDQRQKEADQAVARLEKAERSLQESLGGGPDPEARTVYPTLDPLAAKEESVDLLAGLRLEAWVKLFGRSGIKADLWVTGPGAAAFTARKYEEETGQEPVALSSLDSGKGGEILARAGLEQLQDPKYGFLDLVWLESADLPALFSGRGKPSGPGSVLGIMKF